MEIFDSINDIHFCYEAGTFSLTRWRVYMQTVYPSAIEQIENDAACYDFQQDILPVLNAAANQPEKLVQLQRSFLSATCHLEAEIDKYFQTAIDADIILYLGLCNGAGWATHINGKPVVLLGIEKIMELNWMDETSMIALIYHELGHLWHRQERKLAWGGKTAEEKAVWQLYSEGVAMFFEQRLCQNENFFHQNRDGWLKWCTQNKTRLFTEYIRRIEQNESIQDFFGDWCSFEGHSDVGYYLGSVLIQTALKEYSTSEIPDLSLSEVKRILYSCM